MRRHYRNDQRDILFEVFRGQLVRTTVLPDGRRYVQRCMRQTFEDVAYAIEERAEDGVTLGPLAEAIDAPSTQVNVALELLKERGCVVVRGRRSYPASTFLFEDAMMQFLHLAETPD